MDDGEDIDFTKMTPICCQELEECLGPPCRRPGEKRLKLPVPFGGE